MKGKDLEIGSRQWTSAWEKLLARDVVIRSFIGFGLECSNFASEMYFMEGDSICYVQCRRKLGMSLELAKTEDEASQAPFDDFFADLRDRYDARKGKKSGLTEHFLAPVSHVATVLQVYAHDEMLLVPHHPQLLMYYGMLHEKFASRKTEYPRDSKREDQWGTLRRRFEAFLCAQESLSRQITLGQLVVRGT